MAKSNRNGPEKLQILGFKKDPDGIASSGESSKFVVDINPESMKLSRSLRFNTGNNANTQEDINQFEGYGKDKLSFDLVFDGLGIISKKVNVADRLTRLQKVIYNYDGSKHKANYLVIIWGSFGFKCHLENLSIEYNLFKGNGEPLRAKVNLSFLGHKMNQSVELRANKQSPDMTHLKTIRIGDRLPLMCNEIYDDPNYYLDIAELNGLVNFRNLEIGERVLFPPLEK